MYKNNYSMCMSSEAVRVTSKESNVMNEGPRSYTFATLDQYGKPAGATALRAQVATFFNHATRHTKQSFVVDLESFDSTGGQRNAMLRLFEEMGPLPVNVSILPSSGP